MKMHNGLYWLGTGLENGQMREENERVTERGVYVCVHFQVVFRGQAKGR